MRILITAGGTREYIDPVRFIANASTGKMGYALARAARQAGHEVTLISATTTLRRPQDVTLVAVQTAQDMYQAVQDCFFACDVLIMAAAVSDYTVATPSDKKLKKQHQTLTLQLEPTVDILQWAGAEKHRCQHKKRIVVGFALEDEDVQGRAEEKLCRKQLDMVIANQPAAIGADKSELSVKTPETSWQIYPMATKATQARRLIQAIEKMAS